MKVKTKEFLAFIYVGSWGSSWARATNPEEAVKKAVKTYRRDWLGDSPKVTTLVHVFDYTEAPGFVADHRGVLDSGTQQPLPLILAKHVNA
jgi:hypothetical protein